MTTRDFILAHRDDDIRSLALTHSKNPDVDLPYALEQIAGWQTACRKLPAWAACEGLIYPPRLSMEQCSSEPTARYKADLMARLAAEMTIGGHEDMSLTDLTGGFGVDFSFLARGMKRAVYVEHNPQLCDIAKHNMPLLGLSHARIVCADAADYLQNMPHSTFIFLDPARRDANGGKTVAIADCTPDVSALCDVLMTKAHVVMVKLSPMLDWHKAVDDLHGLVSEVHIVSAGGECKELLLILRSGRPADNGITPRLYCSVCTDNGHETLECTGYRTIPVSTHDHPTSAAYLYEPNPSIMKAGCFSTITRRFDVKAVDTNSHLFLSDRPVAGFPGRKFCILTVTTMNKKQLRTALDGIDRANIAVRNFPLQAADLRRKLKLKDGGNIYIFATTSDNAHLLFVCEKDQTADI